MMVSIQAETSLWTAIEVRNANSEVVFDGVLKMEPDWWTLYRGTGGYYDEKLGCWAGRREYLAVLGDALKCIAKATGT